MNLTATGFLEGIYLAANRGEPMLRVKAAAAIVGAGLRGDRYAKASGYYSNADPCQVTIVSGEDLDRMRRLHGVSVHDGQHRRNLVIREVPLAELTGRRFRIGEVLFEYDRPRPPCAYVQRLTEPGMTRALGEGAGIAVRVLEAGLLREGDPIVVLPGVAKRRRLP